MTTDSHHQLAPEIAHPAHARCVLCGQQNPWGLNLAFRKCADGSVEGSFEGNGFCEGYPAMMHGGIISLLLDGVMTNCLFAHGCTAVTARMSLAFRHPVQANSRVKLRAWIEQADRPVYRVKAELVQQGKTKATAEAVFMDRTELNQSEEVG